MSVNQYNSEKYYDPTGYLALSKIEREEKQRFRKRVFICSPFAGDTDFNVRKARSLLIIYINGLYWKQIAASISSCLSGDSVRKTHQKFLSKN